MSSSATPTPWLLVVTVGIDYIAPARMPRELQRAGFKVALLAPQSSLAAHTAFVDRIAYFPAAATLFEWMRALAVAVRAVDPVLILPGDDIALRTMMQLVLDPPAGIDATMQGELETVIRRSLGDSDGWLDSIDKTRLFELAQQHGVSVAPGAIATGGDAAISVAADIGYPVIVRAAYGSAGSAAALLAERRAVARSRAARRDDTDAARSAASRRVGRSAGRCYETITGSSSSASFNAQPQQ